MTHDSCTQYSTVGNGKDAGRRVLNDRDEDKEDRERRGTS